jgi:biofilm PGA synthesis protein PgaA
MRLIIFLFFATSLIFSTQANALRFYSTEKYEAARERAVQKAKDGDLSGALKSLSRLLKLEPDNQGALYDYITILVWNEENKKALEQLSKITPTIAPEYVLRALVSAARKEREEATLDRLIKVYVHRYSFVPEDTPELISGKSMHEVAELAAQSDLYLVSLSILKQLYQNAPEDQNILADYIVILTKMGRDHLALTLLPNLDLDNANDNVITALIGSANRLDEAAIVDELKEAHLNKNDARNNVRISHDEKFEAAIDKAVQEAKNGHLSTAIKSLSGLLEIEPDNQRILYDYITILVWNKNDKQALNQLSKIELEKAPEYVLRSLARAANNEKNKQIIDDVIKTYMQRYSFVPDDAPELISGKSLHAVAGIAASRDLYLVSLSILEQLYQQNPHDQTILDDYIIILTKAGNYDEALNLMPELNLKKANSEVIAALISSASNLNDTKKLDELNEVYESKFASKSSAQATTDVLEISQTALSPVASTKEGAQPSKQLKNSTEPKVTEKSSTTKVATPQETTIQLASKLVDVNDYEQAYKLLIPMYLEGYKSEEFLILMARLFSRIGQHIRSAGVFKQLLELAPDSDRYKKELILQLSYASATHLALEELAAKPTLLDQLNTDAMELDSEVQKLRWSQYKLAKDVDEKSYLAEITNAIHHHLSALDDTSDKNIIARTTADYIMALYLSGETKKVILEYERSQSENIELAAYALIAVADSYLSEYQADIAVEMYLSLLQKTPGNFELQRSLFYAYSDAGEYDLALQLATGLAEEAPSWRKDHTGEIVKSNQEKLSAAILLANAFAFRDDLTQAQINLEKLREQAPYNAEIRANLSTIYRWRGWPEKAYKEAAIARTINAEDQYIQLVNARALMDMQDYQAAEDVIQQLNNNTAIANNSLIELNKDWDERNKREFYSRFEVGSSTPKSGDVNNSNFGSSDLSLESYLYDKTQQHYYRPFIHQYYAEADFDEGKGRYERIGIGVEYKKKKNFLLTELSQSYKGESEIGLSVKGQHDVSDYLKLSYGFDSRSTKVPVRANFHDITGKDYTLGLTYRLHELTQVSGGLEYLDYTDGNERKTGVLTASHRIVNKPYYKLTLRPSVYYATNSSSSGPYFSPERVSETNFSVDNEWLTYRRHNLEFKQRLELNLGLNNQKGYSNHSTNAIVYQHEWAIEKSLYINYGVKYAKNYYDGDREDRKSFFASLNW